MAIVIVAADNYSVMYEAAVALLFLIVGLIAGQRRWEQTKSLSHQVTEPDVELPEKAYAA